jgi:hypothetical protein
MSKALSRVVLVLVSGMMGLGLAASATGTTSSGRKVKKLRAPIEALTMDGRRIAYDVADNRTYKKGKLVGGPNRVLVWNVRTGKTTKVSDGQTTGADESSTGAGVIQLAITGSRVAWLMNVGGNLEGDDYLFTSSLLKPKERHVATEVRTGYECSGRHPCAGEWLGGIVAAGNRILVNRWTTDATGSITDGGLYALNGASLKRVVTGTATVEAVAADQQRVVMLHSDGTIGLYSTSGTPLHNVTPTAPAEAVALSGRNLVVLESGQKLALYDANTGTLRKTFSLHGTSLQALAVHGNIAVYANWAPRTGASGLSAMRGLNLSSGKDRLIGRLHHEITIARIDSVGLVYANTDSHGGFAGTLVFLPFKQVAAAVS